MNLYNKLPRNYGQLGNGNYENSFFPVQVRGVDGNGFLTNIVAISAGYYHSLAVDSEGYVYE